MKKVLAVLLVLAMAMSMVACGTSTAPSETSTPAKDNPATSAQTDAGNAAAGKKAAMITAQPQIGAPWRSGRDGRHLQWLHQRL